MVLQTLTLVSNCQSPVREEIYSLNMDQLQNYDLKISLQDDEVGNPSSMPCSPWPKLLNNAHSTSKSAGEQCILPYIKHTVSINLSHNISHFFERDKKKRKNGIQRSPFNNTPSLKTGDDVISFFCNAKRNCE